MILNKKYKPAIDKLFYIVWIPISIIMIVSTVLSFFNIGSLILMLGIDIFIFYFLFSSISGYVEIREDYLYIKFGFILKKQIPYKVIREVIKERKIYSTSFLSLKNALEHIVIKYNKYDDVTVSIKNNDDSIKEIKKRINN